MRNAYLTCLLVVTLASCTFRHDAAVRRMNTWIGHTKDHLIKERGVPTREARLSNGEEVVEYHHTRTASDGSSVGMPVLVGGTPLVIGSGNEVATYSCIVTYYLRDSKIYNWKFQGNDCY